MAADSLLATVVEEKETMRELERLRGGLDVDLQLPSWPQLKEERLVQSRETIDA